MTTTPNPIPIPRDLKPGDVIVDANNERHTCRRVNGDSCYSINGSLWTAIDDNVSFGRWFRTNGRPYGQRAFVIRIERIASKARKAKVDKQSAADRLIDIAHRCVNHVNPKAYAGELAKTKPMADCYLNTLLRRAVKAAKRERAIARRLNGGGK